MKALKSKLVKKMQQAKIRIPRNEGDTFVFEGVLYSVKYVTKAS